MSLGIVFGVLFLVLAAVLYKSRRKKSQRLLEDPALSDSSAVASAIPASHLSALMTQMTESLGKKYRNMEPLAAGGMGIIVKAFDKTENRPVAIKTILPELEANQRALRLFFDEGKAIQRMNHPNIVRFYDVGKQDFLYYVMEFLEGETLKKLLKRTGPLDVALTVKIGTQVARALQHCHENNVIHRDIKPSNIFLTIRGPVKIIDFGIVKLITDQAALQGGTTKIGSPDYAAPEQIQGQVISGKSDIYALGVCLFEMLSAELPYRSSNPLTKGLDEPRNLRTLVPEVPETLAAIVSQCLRPDPKERLTSMELWSRLRAFQI